MYFAAAGCEAVLLGEVRHYKHPHYKYLADADKKNTFEVDRFLSTLRRKRQQVVAQDESFDLYEIDLSDEDAAAE